MSEPQDPTPPPVPPSGSQGWGPGYSEPLGYGQQPQGPTPQGPTPQGPPPHGQPQYGQPQYGQPQYGQPQYGQPQYGAPQYGQPQYGQPQYGQPQYGLPAGYVPPPVQRGIVPLRPLGLGEIYDGAFKSIRSNPRVMFGFSAIIVAIATAVGGLLWWLIIPTISGTLSDTTSDLDEIGQELTDDVASIFGMYALIPFLLLATAILSGVLTVSVSRSVIGQRISVAELWHRHWRRVLVVVGFTALVGVASLAAWGLFVVLAVAVATASPGFGAFVGIVGGIGMFVASVWVSVRLLFMPPVVVLEDGPAWPSIARAWRLTRGSFWRILGIYLLANIIGSVASQVIATPAAFIAMLLVPDFTSGGYVALQSVSMAVSYTLPTVFLAAVVALLYIDTRIRREGLDVQLTRAAEAAAQGVEAR